MSSAVKNEQPKDKKVNTIDIKIPLQKDDETCGIACLLGYYQYLGLNWDYEELNKEVEMLDTGGTLGVNLGIHALQLGMEVTLSSYNLQVFDPSWAKLSPQELTFKLQKQMDAKKADQKLVQASSAYIRYLNLGGKIEFCDSSIDELKKKLDEEIPILVGLSSTFLYQSKREIPDTTELDDINGYPAGHFVVINGYDEKNKMISVCDPYPETPFSEQGSTYCVSADHLMTSIFLGIITYDANFLTIQKRK